MATPGADARDLLASERSATLERIGALRGEYDGIIASSVESNADDEHDPEGSTIAFERAQIGALLAEAEVYLEALDHAVDRLEAGTYWVCDQCGGPIATERLLARPAARTCIGCAATAPGRGASTTVRPAG